MNKIKVAMNVRFGSEAEICIAKGSVRFEPMAGIKGDHDRSGSSAATRGKITLISVNSPGSVSTS
jgi:hypothetical protein